MQAQEVVRRLEGVGPAPVVEAVALAVRLHGSAPDEAGLVELQPRLEAALAALNDQMEGTGRLVERCESLRSKPASSAPAGF